MTSFLLAQFTRPELTVDDVLSPYIFVFYVAFIVAFCFTPVMRAVANYYGIIDEPDNVRKMHSMPVAYLGGVAVFLGWLAGLAISQFLRLHRQEPGLPINVVVNFSIVIGACIIVVLGLWDDIRGVSPWLKIGGQVLAAVFLLANGIGTKSTFHLLEPISIRVYNMLGMQVPVGSTATPEWLILLSSAAMVVFIVVACCNATNLMDGLDGLCGGVTAVIAAGFLFLAVHLAVHGSAFNSNWDALRVVLALALLGAVLGFVPFNFNPASIFMGDTGSMFLGYACATMIILLAQEQSKWFLASLVIFALPIMDTALAFTRRWVAGRPIFSADKFHFHHQLIARGLTVKKTVVISYALALGFALLGATIVFMRTRYAVAIYLVIFASIIVAAYKMGMIHERPRVVTGKRIGEGGDVSLPPQTLEPATVLEIRDDEPRQSLSTSPTNVPGAWTEPSVHNATRPVTQ